jgi:hypothetical protein
LKPAEIIFCTFIPKSNATETFKYLYLGYSLPGVMKEYVLLQKPNEGHFDLDLQFSSND